jgi:hypothetical protein
VALNTINQIKSNHSSLIIARKCYDKTTGWRNENFTHTSNLWATYFFLLHKCLWYTEIAKWNKNPYFTVWLHSTKIITTENIIECPTNSVLKCAISTNKGVKSTSMQ